MRKDIVDTNGFDVPQIAAHVLGLREGVLRSPRYSTVVDSREKYVCSRSTMSKSD